MKNAAWQGNIAGWLDAADSNVETVISVLTRGEKETNDRGVPFVSCPPAIYQQLEEARDRLQCVSDWMISNNN